MGGKRLKDPVHGYIDVPDRWVETIIDTKHFQRLRNIRQLDTTRMVYPAANHTRFEHTLGVYHLGRLAFDQLRDELGVGSEAGSGPPLEKIKKTLECACLLHDIGHFPFSHVGEAFVDEVEIDDRIENHSLLRRLAAKDRRSIYDDADPHEKMSCLIILEEYKEAIEPEVDPIEVCAFILGTSTKDRLEWWQASRLIHSPIDVDRLDYIVRDDFMTGASLVALDTRRMVEAYTIVNNKLGLSMKAQSTIGNFLNGRNAVYTWITQHHKVVYTNALVEAMTAEFLAHRDTAAGATPSIDTPSSPANVFGVKEVLDYGVDDTYLIERIRSMAHRGDSDYLTALWGQYANRSYLASCWKHIHEFRRTIQDKDYRRDIRAGIGKHASEVREEIQSEFGLPREQVLVRMSNTPEDDGEEVDDIYLDQDGTARDPTDLDMYQAQEIFYKSVPHIFVPAAYVDDVITYIKDGHLPSFGHRDSASAF